jgi:hypothetical protein
MTENQATNSSLLSDIPPTPQVPSTTPGRAVDQVEAALRAIPLDRPSAERLAVVSIVYRHGEAAWQSEIIYQLWRRGSTTLPESPAGGQKLIDIVVDEEIFELKATRWLYALKNYSNGPVEATMGWLGKDLWKLQRASVPTYQVVTMATLIEVLHLNPGRERFNRTPIDAASRNSERQRALEVYKEYAARIADPAIPVKHIDLGEVPLLHPGRVHLDALIICVRS